MITREEIVANVLHILSSSTHTSPLLCRCERRESVDGRESGINFSWDPLFVSLSKSMVDANNDNARVVPISNSKFLYNWLNGFLPTLHDCHRHTNLTEIRNAFVDTSNMDNMLKRQNKPTDGDLWQAGLQLLRTHLYPNETLDEKDITAGDKIHDKNLDPIPPHILLQTVMDSYHGHDIDSDLGNLNRTDEGPMKIVTSYYLPTSISIFFLRSFLMAHAIESANESIQVSRDKSQPVRWKRLKSMVDDARAFFRLMTFEYTGRAIGNYIHGSEPVKVNAFHAERLQLEPNMPVEPTHIISVATWLYTNLLLPCSHSLLGELLKNEPFSVGTQSQHRGKLLESCYDTFSMLTTLLALDVSGVVQDYSSPSCCVRWALQCIDSKSTSDFFDLVMLETARYNNTTDGIDSEDRQGRMYRPWTATPDDLRGRGLSLCEDLLLSPTFRKMNEETDEVSDNTYYDELGIAYMAYWRLIAQAKGISGSVDPL